MKQPACAAAAFLRDSYTHFARLPGTQAPSSVWSRLRDFGINLLPQQRGGLNYRVVNCLFAIKLTNSRTASSSAITCYTPFMRLCRTDLRTSGALANV
jgi:hypothetical protein